MAASDKSNSKAESTIPKAELPGELQYIQYQHSLESQYLPAIRALISKDLSEPYSIYVYRYFLCQWGHLCFMVSLSACIAVPCIDRADTSPCRHSTLPTPP